MPAADSVLFTPFRIGRLTIPGRVVKSATSETRAADNGTSTQAMIDFYEPIARGGTPLIITGNIYVSPDGRSTPNQLGIEDDAKVPALAALVAAVHAHGSAIFAQLNHCGRQVLPRSVGLTEALSASDVKDLSTGVRPRAMTVPEIRAVVERFGDAAQRCRKAGFDGIQVHAAHGYLVSQFLTPHTNRRTDEYGGPLENRVRLLREIHQAIRARVGRDYPVIIKLNGADALPLRDGLDTDELVDVARIVEADGIDAVEVSVGHYESGFPVVRGRFFRGLREMARGSARHLPRIRRTSIRAFWPAMAVACNVLWSPREGFNLRYARRFKQALGIPVICVGGFLSREAMEAAIEAGACDAVSAARAFIADPLLYPHLREATPGPRCNDCNACIGSIGEKPIDCYHPRIRAEKDRMLGKPTTHHPQ